MTSNEGHTKHVCYARGWGTIRERGKKKNNSIKLLLFNYYKRQKKQDLDFRYR